MGATGKGSLSVVDDLTSTSSTKALSAAKGKELEDKRAKGEGSWGLLDYKWSGRKFSPSALEPWFRADEDQTLLSANWSDLVTLLRATPLEVGGVTAFEVSGFATGSVTRLQLTDTLVNRNLIRAILEDYHFSKSYTSSTNADGTDDDTAFSNWGFIIRVATTIGTGANAPTAGQEYRVRYLTSLANTLSATNRYICVDKDTSSSATTGTGTIEIYPYRIASGGVPTTTSAKWRKVGEAGLMTPGSTFYSGTDLMEVPANVRVRDRFQSHWHELGVNPDVGPGGGNQDTSEYATSIRTGLVQNPTTDGPNGAPRTGPNSRERAGVAYLYAYGKTYTP